MKTISLQSVRRGMRSLIASRARSCLAPSFVALTFVGLGAGSWLGAGAHIALADGPGQSGCGQVVYRTGNDPTCFIIPGATCIDPAGSAAEKYSALKCGVKFLAGAPVPCGFPNVVPGGCP